MLNSIEAAVSTLEEAGALAYEITQPGSFKHKAEAADTQALIDRFLSDWDKLVPGMYKVDYAKTANDKRGGLCFRISKVQAAYGSPAQLAGIDGDVIGGLQRQITNLETERRIEAIQAQHREELRALEAKHEKSDGLGGIDGPTFLAGLDKMQNLFNSVTNRTSAAVGGPAQLPAGTPALALDENALATALTSLEKTLGGEALIAALTKLATKGQNDPDGLRKGLGYIDLL